LLRFCNRGSWFQEGFEDVEDGGFVFVRDAQELVGGDAIGAELVDFRADVFAFIKGAMGADCDARAAVREPGSGLATALQGCRSKKLSQEIVKGADN
jgi:hypothetical protein